MDYALRKVLIMFSLDVEKNGERLPTIIIWHNIILVILITEIHFIIQVFINDVKATVMLETWIDWQGFI